MYAILLGFVLGIGLPIQTAVNSRLKAAAKSPLIASFLSFTTGCIALSLLLLITRPEVATVSIHQQPWWLWIGGFLGAVFLTGNVLLLSRLGSFQTVLMPIIGQVVMSMLLDNWGLFGSKLIPITVFRLLGAFLVLAGTLTIIFSPKTKNKPKVKATNQYIEWWWRLVGLITGAFSALQTAINGHLGIVFSSSLVAAAISFSAGCLVLLLVVIIKEHSILRQLKLNDFKKLPYWAWLGGLIGAGFVLGNIIIMPQLGTGLAIMVVLTGQLVGSLLLEQFGWLNVPRRSLQKNSIIGLGVIVAGIYLIKFF